MAEDTQEELSMEDILSSIKDILLDDNAVQQAQKDAVSEKDETAPVDEPVKAAPAVEPEAPKEDIVDDILTLSPAMMVDDEEEVPALPEPETLDFEHELEDLSSEHLLDGIDAAVNLREPEEEPGNTEVEKDGAENFTVNDTENFSIKGEVEDTINSLPEIKFEEDAVDIESEPIYSSEDDALSIESGFTGSDNEEEEPAFEESIIDDATLNAILDAQPEDPVMEAPEEEDDFVEPTDNVYEAAVENQANEPAEEDVSKQEEAEDVLHTEPAAVQSEATEDEAVDLSASIISNFAKMFADNQQEKTAELPHETVKEKLASQAMDKIDLGNGSLTIEAIVRDVVTEIVEKNLEADYNFAKTASEEIAKQTKVWLSHNLPKIVEATVQKEIERVMAKVSS